MDTLNAENLVEGLRGPESQQFRARLVDRLKELEIRLQAEAAIGTPTTEFRQLQAALLAVRAGLDTLHRLEPL
ncbi:MAG: hypothetical protein RI949_3033 [Pseudomonadota bacterium]|jgi:phage regulator Rha-like protein